jgi:hypothetical protein
MLLKNCHEDHPGCAVSASGRRSTLRALRRRCVRMSTRHRAIGLLAGERDKVTRHSRTAATHGCRVYTWSRQPGHSSPGPWCASCLDWRLGMFLGHRASVTTVIFPVDTREFLLHDGRVVRVRALCSTDRAIYERAVLDLRAQSLRRDSVRVGRFGGAR